MEQSRQKLSARLHGSALPPPPRNRPMIFGAIAAIVWAVAAGIAAYTHELRVAHLTIASGVVVGMAIIRAKGYGMRLMQTAAMLTVLSVVLGNFVNYYVITISGDPTKANPGSFFDHLQATSGLMDLMFAAVSVALAVGLIHLRTTRLEHRAKAKMLAERQP